jgi:hypothetical protein
VNFPDLGGIIVVIFAVVYEVTTDCVEAVVVVDVVVVANLDLVVDSGLIHNIPPFLRMYLPITSRELPVIPRPCYPPDPRCIFKQQ